MQNSILNFIPNDLRFNTYLSKYPRVLKGTLGLENKEISECAFFFGGGGIIIS